MKTHENHCVFDSKQARLGSQGWCLGLEIAWNPRLPAFTDILQRQLGAGEPSLLVIAPTRELAIQIQEESDKRPGPIQGLSMQPIHTYLEYVYSIHSLEI